MQAICQLSSLFHSPQKMNQERMDQYLILAETFLLPVQEIENKVESQESSILQQTEHLFSSFLWWWPNIKCIRKYNEPLA